MPVRFEKVQGNVVCVHASGKLTDEDYKASFIPTMEDLMHKWGHLRMLFVLDGEFDGWDLHGAWDEFKFELAHRHELIKVGVVGEERWQRWATKLSSLLTSADVRFYPRDEESDAREWVASGW